MLRIRAITIADVPLLRRMIVEFATFERLADQVTITDVVGSSPRFRGLLPEWDGQVAGYAIYFNFYSSFEGPGLFIEDVYVREEFRSKGIGKALMAEIAAIALHEGLVALRWGVLDWNRPAIDFYKRLGAAFLDDWKAVRLEGEGLRRLAGITQ